MLYLSSSCKDEEKQLSGATAPTRGYLTIFAKLPICRSYYAEHFSIVFFFYHGCAKMGNYPLFEAISLRNIQVDLFACFEHFYYKKNLFILVSAKIKVNKRLSVRQHWIFLQRSKPVQMSKYRLHI